MSLKSMNIIRLTADVRHMFLLELCIVFLLIRMAMQYLIPFNVTGDRF
jgi:hypothetical protein